MDTLPVDLATTIIYAAGTATASPAVTVGSSVPSDQDAANVSVTGVTTHLISSAQPIQGAATAPTTTAAATPLSINIPAAGTNPTPSGKLSPNTAVKVLFAQPKRYKPYSSWPERLSKVAKEYGIKSTV